MPTRAPALPPLERRTHLVAVTRRLVARGAVPSTREIAEAAGVAEGTIFRVFDTKDELLDAVVSTAFCPAGFRRGVAEIDAGLPLGERLVALVTLLQQRFTEVFGLMKALGLSAPPPAMWRQHARCTPESGHLEPEAGSEPDAACASGEARESDDARSALLAEQVVGADAPLLRCTPAQLVTYLRLLTFSGSHPHISGGDVLTPTEIVDVILRGTQNDCRTTEVATHERRAS